MRNASDIHIFMQADNAGPSPFSTKSHPSTAYLYCLAGWHEVTEIKFYWLV